MLRAYDPDRFLHLLGIPHQLVPIENADVRLIPWDKIRDRIDTDYLSWHGEMIFDDQFQRIQGLPPKIIFHGARQTSEFQLPIDTVFYPDHLIWTYITNKDLGIIPTLREPNTNKPFLADVLMGLPKPHRWRIVNKIIDKGLFDRCLINYHQESSFTSVYHTNLGLETVWPQYGQSKDIVSSQLRYYEDQPVIESKEKTGGSFVSTTKDTRYKHHWLSRVIPTKIYQSTWISVIGETESANSLYFPTEKIAKPLLAGRIFLACGCQHYLKNLRNDGFQTFGNFIDESYDEISDMTERVDAMIDVLAGLSKENMFALYEKALPVLKHNQEVISDITKLAKESRQFMRFRYQIDI